MNRASQVRIEEARLRYEVALSPLIGALRADGLDAEMVHAGGGCLQLWITPEKLGGMAARWKTRAYEEGPPLLMMTSAEPDCASLYDETLRSGPYALGVYSEHNAWGLGPAFDEADVDAPVGIEFVGAACWKLLARAGVGR